MDNIYIYIYIYIYMKEESLLRYDDDKVYFSLKKIYELKYNYKMLGSKE